MQTTNTKRKRYLVLAGNKRQADKYIMERKSAGEIHDFIYIDRPEKAYGLETHGVIVVGTFWEEVKKAGEIYSVANERVRL